MRIAQNRERVNKNVLFVLYVPFTACKLGARLDRGSGSPSSLHPPICRSDSLPGTERLFVAFMIESPAAAVFKEFPKIARLSRECIISEKIDGTNASVYNGPNGEFLTGSRTRWITPEDDNYGFSRWAHDHRHELTQLGEGTHFGEWWGSGCQRGYNLPKGEKRFSLFNAIRWTPHGTEPQRIPTEDPRIEKYQQVAPVCCHIVPVLYRGMFVTEAIDDALSLLRADGSQASPGFMKPEGVVCFHIAANIGFKKTLEKDDVPKMKQRG